MIAAKRLPLAPAAIAFGACWVIGLVQATASDPDVEVVRAASERTGNTYVSAYTIAGLPQQDFLLNQNYTNAIVHAIRFEGTRGYLIQPTMATDPKRRWIWVSPLWVAFNSPTWGDSFLRFYVQRALDAGFHVAGLDVGATCGSPKGADLYQEFYSWIVRTYDLNPKVRMVGVSNGGLITYAWAFRHPQHVDRILGIYPATDMRTWPGLQKACGTGHITPAGLEFPYATAPELEKHLDDVNPIANLRPLAQEAVRVFHVHGDKDELVPLGPNSSELKKRYLALGGDMRLDVFEGEAHGGTKFFQYEPAAEFLIGD